MTKPSPLLLGAIALAILVTLNPAISNALSTRAATLAAASGQPRLIVGVITAGNPRRGEIVYGEKCGICHNAGGMGPSLKGEKSRMTQAAAVAWIKNPKPPMPKFYPSPLSEGDVNDVAAYVETLTGPAQGAPAPAAGNASQSKTNTVAVAPAAGELAQGKALFGKSCASCHGATGTEGGVGPSLKAEKSKKDRGATIAWIKNPKPPMPKLYPAPLSDPEVRAIATYVETL